MSTTRRTIGKSMGAAALLLGAMLAALPGGCSDAGPTLPARPPARDANSGGPLRSASRPRAGSAPEDEVVDRQESWDLVFLQGKRIGTEQTTVTRLRCNGRELIRTESLGRMDVVRDGRPSTETIRAASLETPDGRLLEVSGETSSVRVQGRVEGGELQLEVSSQGRTARSAIAWQPDFRGPFADQQTLRAQPLEPGERRTLKALQFLITHFQPVTVELAAQDYETVPLLTGNYRLLRVDVQTHLPDGQSISGVLWCDRTGEILKSRTLGLETLRTTREVAEQRGTLAELDLIRDFSVPVARPLPDAHRTRKVRYLVRLADGDPAAVFVADQSQQVEPVDEHRARIIVRALRPQKAAANPDAGQAGPGPAPAAAASASAAEKDGAAASGRANSAGAAPAAPGDEYCRPNGFIQSDDPKLVALARQAAAAAPDAWAKAVALEQFAHEYIEIKDFSQSFATAAEVAREPAGDCTEHAVFLAALCRAAGLPARVAVGLVYVPAAQAFGYHMWTEVFIEDQWIGLDATLGLGGIGAAHLKLAHHSLADASAFTGFVPVMQVIGRLEIEIEEVE